MQKWSDATPVLRISVSAPRSSRSHGHATSRSNGVIESIMASATSQLWWGQREIKVWVDPDKMRAFNGRPLTLQTRNASEMERTAGASRRAARVTVRTMGKMVYTRFNIGVANTKLLCQAERHRIRRGRRERAR